MVVEEAGKPLARSIAVTSEDDFLARFPKLGGVRDDRFIDIDVLRSLGREVAWAFDREVDDAVTGAFGKGSGEVDRTLGGGGFPLFLRKVER